MRRLPDPHDTPLLTVEEAAEVLGISRSTAYRRVDDGTLPVLRLGDRTTRVVTGELLRLLAIDAPQQPRSAAVGPEAS